MSSYVVELYRPRSDERSQRRTVDRLAASARQTDGEGAPVRYVDTILVPGDETCLHLFEAGSEADVWNVVHRAGIEVDRGRPRRSRPGAIARSGADAS
jgi:hypothetical protein